MKLNTDRLNAFYQVALDKSFCKAADALCITQSALSQRVLKIEQEVGCKLLIRGNDGIGLTEQGKLLYQYALEQQAREQDVLNNLSGRSAIANGIVRIGAFSSVMRSVIMPSLMPLINSPHQLKAEFYSKELRDLLPLLMSGEVDFIVANEVVDDPLIESIVLGEETLVHIRNKELSNQTLSPCFLDHDVHDMTTFNFFSAQDRSDFEFDRSFYDDVYGILDGVRLGFGEAIISQHMLKEDDCLEVVSYDQSIKSSVVLCYIKDRYLSALQKQIIEHLVKNVPFYL